MTTQDPSNHQNDFLGKLKGIISENLSNEQFGVSKLATKVGMSRSSLLRKVKKMTGLSVSRFIRQVRLEEAMVLLRQQSLTVSEVSYEVGFGSTSYFIKCFRDHYGYPPGEAGTREQAETGTSEAGSKKKVRTFSLVFVSLLVIFSAVLLYVLYKPAPDKTIPETQSIAVLPFINDSQDSSNVHIINGLMESTLNNLQKIKGLRVISRTSVERYRDNPKRLPDIAKELHVDYIVEGSGQKIGEQIKLHIQLIDAQNDIHLWSEQYSREIKDIFALQSELARSIAGQIEVILTPEEEAIINEPPTEDLVAYDFFLQGLELLRRRGKENLHEAIRLFDQAIAQDGAFARAYAATAIAYYLLDEFQAEKQYVYEVNHFADKALFYDSRLPQSLIAKALYYMLNEDYKLAVKYFEKALEYNPNADIVYAFLVDLYANHLPDTQKYLEYALRGLQIDAKAYDSVTMSFNYLHISNAFIQAGFVDEAMTYIKNSLDYYPTNIYSAYVKAYILYARDRDMQKTREQLIEVLKMDTNRIDVLQEVGKICYFQKDYERSHHYYRKYLALKTAYQLDIYKAEDAKIGLVFAKMGNQEKAEELLRKFKAYVNNDRSIYKHLSMAAYHAYRGDTAQVMQQLRQFSKEEHFHYWTVLFADIDPLFENYYDLPEFKRIWQEIDTKFWEWHRQVRESLVEKNLI